MSDDFIKIHLPNKEKYLEKVDLMMELGDISAYETVKHTLTIIDTWDNKESLLAKLSSWLPEELMEIEKVPDQDWNKKWIDGFQPLRIGEHFVVTPPWHKPDLKTGDIKIIINPGQAFGTGTHESSQLILSLMEKYSPEGKSVLDIGCGSGILSIAARYLSASSVRAVDYDPVFTQNMSDNLEFNGMDDILYEVADVFTMKTFPGDYVMMNIEKHIILPALNKITNEKIFFPELLLAGLLIKDFEQVKTELTKMGYTIIDSEESGEWIGLYCKYNDSRKL